MSLLDKCLAVCKAIPIDRPAEKCREACNRKFASSSTAGAVKSAASSFHYNIWTALLLLFITVYMVERRRR